MLRIYTEIKGKDIRQCIITELNRQKFISTITSTSQHSTIVLKYQYKDCLSLQISAKQSHLDASFPFCSKKRMGKEIKKPNNIGQ